MQNTIIVVGALAGIVIGGFLGHWMFSDGSGIGGMVPVIKGAIPGTVVGAWIAARMANRESETRSR